MADAFLDALDRAQPLILDGGLATQLEAQGCAQRGLSANEADALMLRSVELAMQARDEFVAATAPDFAPLVAASIGPYGAVLHDGSEYRGDYGVAVDDLRRFHEARLRLFDASGADVLAFETIPSLPEAEVLAGLLQGCRTPAWVSFSCKDDAHISDGSPIETAVALFRDHPVVEAIGINCTPPQFATALIQKIREVVPDKAIMA
jgi:homocysteine S-methyltransferase